MVLKSKDIREFSPEERKENDRGGEHSGPEKESDPRLCLPVIATLTGAAHSEQSSGNAE